MARSPRSAARARTGAAAARPAAQPAAQGQQTQQGRARANTPQAPRRRGIVAWAQNRAARNDRPWAPHNRAPAPQYVPLPQRGAQQQGPPMLPPPPVAPRRPASPQQLAQAAEKGRPWAPQNRPQAVQAAPRPTVARDTAAPGMGAPRARARGAATPSPAAPPQAPPARGRATRAPRRGDNGQAPETQSGF
ncbi:hypothetical protein GCM10023205_71720 [Yinghuangia aomiensis]|uniref:Uncharacterized protein n=1 Tax=Yinghuangia aomiensis TaxID=676205 RepID=A0ABP9I7V8_9ACTN